LILSTIIVVSLIVLVTLTSPGIHSSLASSPWPTFHQNPQHTGLSPFQGPSVPVLKWKFSTGGSILSSPAIAFGTIYIGSDDGNLYALNRNGVLKWKFTTGGSIESSPAVARDGTIYVESSDGYLYAIRPSGRLEWKLNIIEGTPSSPTVGSDGTIYVGGATVEGYYGLYAVRPNGTVKWVAPAGAEIYDSPAIGGDGTIYIGIDDPSPTGACAECLQAVNPDGTIKWGSFPGNSFSSPAVGSDGTIYIDGSAVSPDGNVKWQNPGISGSPSIGSDGTIYGSVDGGVAAVKPDGAVQWKFSIGTSSGSCITPDCSVISYVIFQESSVAIGSNGILYFGSGVSHITCGVSGCTGYGTGNVYAMAPNGTMAWKFRVGSTNELNSSASDPAIGSDGTVYVGSSDGSLYAIG
jgi:outer membrane protein assembly factor BamB